MCWSTSATATFTVIYILAIIVVVYMRRNNWFAYTVTLSWFTAMEAYQFSQWQWGMLVLSNFKATLEIVTRQIEFSPIFPLFWFDSVNSF